MTAAESNKRTRPRVPKLDEVKLDPKVTPEHFVRWQGDIVAVSSRELAPSNVNVTRGVIVAIGASVNLLAARAEIVATLSNFRVGALDDLVSIAYAAWHTDLLWRIANDVSLSCADLMPEVEDLRDLLLTQARAQVKRKRIPQSLLDTVEPGSGIEDRANDLTALAYTFRSRWSEFEGKVDLTPAELDRADELAAKLLGRLAARAVPTRKEGELSPTEVRARAWTLLVNAYDECRRGAAALWWYESGGWEQYAPSLRQGQGRGASRGGGSDGDEPTPPPPPPTPA